jgi:hypothetical protein
VDLDPNVSCPRIVRLKKDTSPPRISSSQQGRKDKRKNPLLESFGGLEGGVDRVFSTLQSSCASSLQSETGIPIFIFILNLKQQKPTEVDCVFHILYAFFFFLLYPVSDIGGLWDSCNNTRKQLRLITLGNRRSFQSE